MQEVLATAVAQDLTLDGVQQLPSLQRIHEAECKVKDSSHPTLTTPTEWLPPEYIMLSNQESSLNSSIRGVWRVAFIVL